VINKLKRVIKGSMIKSLASKFGVWKAFTASNHKVEEENHIQMLHEAKQNNIYDGLFAMILNMS